MTGQCWKVVGTLVDRRACGIPAGTGELEGIFLAMRRIFQLDIRHLGICVGKLFTMASKGE